MGQKVNPHGLRVGVIKDWDSRWYARPDKVGDLIVEDDKIRKYLKKRLYAAGVPTIEIERDSAQVRIFIHCSRPGVIIGKGGTEIEVLRQKIEAKLGKTVALNIVEVRSPDLNAQLVAENIAAQLALREPCVVELYSDSKYVIDALEKGWAWGWKRRGWVKADKKPARLQSEPGRSGSSRTSSRRRRHSCARRWRSSQYRRWTLRRECR